MEALLLIVVGIVIGILFTILWNSIRASWRKSKDLRSSSVKTRKEVHEKSLKAKQDAQKANDAVFRAGLHIFFLVIALIIVSWMVWNIIQI